MIAIRAHIAGAPGDMYTRRDVARIRRSGGIVLGNPPVFPGFREWRIEDRFRNLVAAHGSTPKARQI